MANRISDQGDKSLNGFSDEERKRLELLGYVE